MARPSPHFDHHLAEGPDEIAGDLNAVARSAIRKGGVLVGERRGVNLIEGTGITLGVVDDPGNERVNVTVTGPTVPGSLPPDGPAGGDLSGTYPNPQIASGVIVNADVNGSAAIAESKLSLATDAAAGTGSRRTLGTGGTQACAGNDARLSDQRTPTDSSVTVAKVGTDWPRFIAQKSTQSISAATETAITFTSGNEVRKVGFSHSSGASVVDLARDCCLVVTGWVEFNSGVYDSELNVQIRQAGFVVAKTGIVCNGAHNPVLTTSTVVDYSSGDDLQLYCYQDTGSSMTIQAARFAIAFAGNG